VSHRSQPRATPEGPNYEYNGMHTIRLEITLPREPPLAIIADGNAWLRRQTRNTNALPRRYQRFRERKRS